MLCLFVLSFGSAFCALGPALPTSNVLPDRIIIYKEPCARSNTPPPPTERKVPHDTVVLFAHRDKSWCKSANAAFVMDPSSTQEAPQSSNTSALVQNAAAKEYS